MYFAIVFQNEIDMQIDFSKSMPIKKQIKAFYGQQRIVFLEGKEKWTNVKQDPTLKILS